MARYTIDLIGISAHAYHGVLDHEQRDGQPFSVDTTVEIDSRDEDSIDATVSYADIAAVLHAGLTQTRFDLLETLADHLAAAVTDMAGVRAVTVRVHKPEAPIEVPFDDVVVTASRSHAPAERPGPIRAANPELDQVPQRPTRAVMALGANQGNAPDNLARAITDLAHAEGISLIAASSITRTSAEIAAGQSPQADYANAVVQVTTTLSATDLLDLANRMEAKAGRVRNERWGARTLDVDIITYGNLVSDDPHLTLPHPRAARRRFVLEPWAQIDPDAVLPGAGPISDLLAVLDAEGQ